jgi:hypothetical protein
MSSNRSNPIGLRASSLKVDKINTPTISNIQKTLKQIVNASPSGQVTGITSKFSELIIQTITEKIINIIIKELCKLDILPEDYCYYYKNDECCENNLVKNLNNSIFKSLSNNSLFSDENFSLLSTEIIEDNIYSTDIISQNIENNINDLNQNNEEIQNDEVLNDNINSINSIFTDTEILNDNISSINSIFTDTEILNDDNNN